MNKQRALWTFLILTLAGPFVAAILAALYTPFAIWANFAPFTAGDHGSFDAANLPDAGGVMQLMSRAAITTFVWSPVAAAVAGLVMAFLLITRGQVNWAIAGVAGVVGFFVAYVIAPFGAGDLLPMFALAAGIDAALLCLFMINVGILPRPD